MKKLLIVLTLFSVIACYKEETPLPINDTINLNYNFIDRDLHGQIEGYYWEITFGTANYNAFFKDHYFYFYSISDTNYCDNITPKSDYVSFALNELKPQLIELDFANSATFYSRSDTLGIGAFDGAIEILTVDTINTMTITGRMDVRESNTTYVNGNFSITYCK
jgi:hypothetical protein